MNFIKLTQEEIEAYLTNLRTKLEDVDVTSDITIKINKVKPKAEKAKLIFTEKAYNKMRMLVLESDKEIGWHGFTHRAGNKFYVDDIIVFPQTVTAATVTSDEKLYTDWTLKLTDEEYNKMHFHGHSHVNMATNPSNVDTNYYESKVKNIEDYYIFVIMNKSDNTYARIYDFENNIYYEKDDIEIIRPMDKYKVWADEQIKEFVSEQKPKWADQRRYATGYDRSFWENYSQTPSGQFEYPTTRAGYHYAGSKQNKTKDKKQNKMITKSGKLTKRLQNILDTHQMSDIKRLSEEEALFLVELITNDPDVDMKVSAEWAAEEYDALIDIAYASMS